MQGAVDAVHACARTEDGRIFCWGAATDDIWRGLLVNRSGTPAPTAVQGDRIWEDAQAFDGITHFAQPAPIPTDLPAP